MQIILKYITQFNDRLDIVVKKSSVLNYKFFNDKLMINFKITQERKGIIKNYEWSFIQLEKNILNLSDVQIFLKLNCKQL